MNGTTLCPHCNTRFRIAGDQLEAHQGMVRCGHCMQAFDARPGFIPDQPDPQLELPIVDQRVAPAVPPPPAAAAVPAPVATPEPAAEAQPEEPKPEEAEVKEAEAVETKPEAQESPKPELPEPESLELEAQEVSAQDRDEVAAGGAPVTDETPATDEAPHDGSLDFVPAANDATSEEPAKPLVIQAPQLAGLDAEEEATEEPPRKPRRWSWIAASSLLALLLLLQATYFFRVELAARLPGLKPVLVGYCGLLGCTVPLPQNEALMSIESSELQADPKHANQITLVALLRNRATHVQAFPVLELSLNDTEDKVLARRLFKPADYLPPTETEAAGLRPNREVNIRLRLDTTDLRPTGYRLALFYPQ